MRRSILIFVFSVFILFACNTPKSRVISFEYGGHYDTAVAILLGEVYEKNVIPGSKDSLFPVANAVINATDSANKNYKTVITDAQGKFSVNFFINGEYNLEIKKEGYQPIKVTNFISDSGQTSTVKIVLEKDRSLF